MSKKTFIAVFLFIFIGEKNKSVLCVFVSMKLIYNSTFTVKVLASISSVISENLALKKLTKSSSVFHNNNTWHSSLMVDGDANPFADLGHCFHSDDWPGGPNWVVVDLADDYYVDRVNLYSRDRCPERLDYFIIGLTSVNYSAIPRGIYPLCGQYKYKAVVRSKLKLKCNANLPSYRYVISQQPADGVGWLTICELEVYEARNLNSKVWSRKMNHKLIGYTSHEMVTNRLLKCLSSCVPGLCHSVNFKHEESICQLNQHLFGYPQTALNNNTGGWSFYEVYYA
ncbi:hypothetical protein HELRODRAFT_180128 [Helobdella robusta]|uniref:Apple domain-containing protein n=1 Tax=Helobdella robusta TaxID=6412 RepID=T1FFH9_HELRO|nr:hypothetical protein HELRODRAFT_180128 [Helobdella robusta]ESN94786.1 hypothetical protein HELRODRAFT_180128 [Helobdella robusta]